MKAPRRPVTLIIVGVVLAVVLVGAELVARTRLQQAVDDRTDGLDGVEVSVSSAPALWQLVTGRADLVVSIDDAALGRIVACSTGLDGLAVSATPSGVVIATTSTVRSVEFPVEVLLVPVHDADGWAIAADSISAAGVSVPVDRALSFVGGTRAEALVDGIRLPSGDGLAVDGLTIGDGIATIAVSVPMRGDGEEGARGGGLGLTGSCWP